MSWFSDLANKAEDLLNNLDQKTAVALHDTSIDEAATSTPMKNTTNRASKSIHLEDAVNTTNINHHHHPSNKGINVLKDSKNKEKSYLTQLSTPRTVRPSKTNLTTSMLKQRDKEDSLLKFLNSDDQNIKSDSGVNNDKHKSINSNIHRSASSNQLHTPKNATRRTSEGDSNKELVLTNGVKNKIEHESSSASDNKNANEDDMDASNGEKSGHTTPIVTYKSRNGNQTIQNKKIVERLNGLELENKLLRKEIASLNEELHTSAERSKRVMQDLDKVKEESQQLKLQLRDAEDKVSRIDSTDGDIQMALDAKDSQLAVLKVRLKEADDELHVKRDDVIRLQNEVDRILEHHTDASDAHGEALDMIKAKLKETEELYQLEKIDRKALKNESIDRINKLEMEKLSLADEIAIAQRKASEEKRRSDELNSHLRTSRANMESLRQELSEYKAKATRILQAKDKMIAKLQDGEGIDDKASIFNLEVEELKKENDSLKEVLDKSQADNYNLRNELQDVEQTYGDELSSLRDQINVLQDNVAEEKGKRDDSEQDTAKSRLQVQYLQNELMAQKTNLIQQKQKYEDDIMKLRKRENVTESNRNEEELEGRIKNLTENLIQKQTIIEALSTEKNSLVVQLERLERQYRDVVKSNEVQKHVAVDMTQASSDVLDDSGLRMRSISSMISSNDQYSDNTNAISHGVKNAAHVLDRISVRVGRFLRYYPVARAMTILYVILLHMWVMFILLTYTPEMHNISPDKPGPKE